MNTSTDQSSEDQNGYSKTYTWYVLILLMTVFTFSHMDRNIISILLNSITEDLNLSDTQGGLISGFAFVLFYATLGLPVARLADRVNRVKIITIALTLWSAMTAVCGLAGNFFQMLLARMGVGVGEAGCVPPAQSIIADYVPKEKRAFAMAVFGLGVPLGTLLGFLVGGYINDAYGWRAALFAVGIPGIALALIVNLTLKEPPRGYSDKIQHIAGEETPSFVEVLKYLGSQRSLYYMTFGASLLVFAGYASQNWIPAFFERSHGITSTAIATWLGPVFILGGAGGMLLSGWLADKMGAKDPRWYMLLPAIVILPAIPVSAIILLIPATTYEVLGFEMASYVPAILLMAIPGAAYSAYLGPTNAMLQQMAGIRMRATTVAIFLLITNICGGFGSLVVGIISDLLSDFYGDESLRYTMLYFLFIYVIAAWFFFLASRHITSDLEQARL